MRHLTLLLLAPLAAVTSLTAACGSTGTSPTGDQPDGGAPDGAATPDAPTGPGGCAASFAGAPCVIALYDQATAGCDADLVTKLRGELDARADLGPLWAGGRGLFRTDKATHVAGEFNGWSTTALASTAVCGTDLFVAVGPVATGFWPYKLFDGAAWSLDARDPAFAYDDFGGNPDGMNSVINTPDSGRGNIIKLPQACSTALGNCRDVTAYLPPGYTAPATAATTYPVLFMHDGQNLWDDHDCCFGHTGWEVNVALDTEIAAGRVAPVIVIGAASTVARNDEYGLTPAKMATFIEFQVTELQPAALAHVRWDHGKLAIAGSSLGALVAMHGALAHPEIYGAVASLSGAFWPGQGDGWALRDKIPGYGKQAMAVYVDSGGDVAQDADGAADTVEVRDLMVGLGWQTQTSPTCTRSDSTVCYYIEPGATHDELAWKARTWRFLRFLFPAH